MVQIDVEFMTLAKRHGIYLFGREPVQPGGSLRIAALLPLMKQVDERRTGLGNEQIIAAQHRTRDARGSLLPGQRVTVLL
jgi:hypothetical protein